jgi:hypothetical protein
MPRSQQPHIPIMQYLWQQQRLWHQQLINF